MVSARTRPSGVADTIQQAVEEWDEVCFQGFSPEERALFTALFTRMTEHVMEFKQGEKEHG